MHTIDFYDDPVDEMLNPIKKPLSEEDEKMMNEFSEPADYKEIPITPGIPKGAKFNVRERGISR